MGLRNIVFEGDPILKKKSRKIENLGVPKKEIYDIIEKWDVKIVEKKLDK